MRRLADTFYCLSIDSLSFPIPWGVRIAAPALASAAAAGDLISFKTNTLLSPSPCLVCPLGRRHLPGALPGVSGHFCK